MTVSYFDAANKLKQEGRLEEAIASYRSAIEKNPNFYWSYPNLGDVLLKVSRWEEAVNAYSRAIELNPDSSAWIYYNQGEALTKLGRWEEAIVCYQRAINLNPDELEIQSSFAEALRQRSQVDLDRAIGMYERAIELNPESVEAYQNLLEIQPKNWEAWWKLGKVLVKENRQKEAIVAYGRAIEINPEFASAYESLLSIQSDNSELWWQLCRVYAQQRERQKAIAAYRRVIELNPDSVAAYQSLAELEPDSWEIWWQLGNVLAKQNQIGEAIAAYEKAVKLNPTDLQAYQSLVELQPDNWESWWQLGNIYAHQNQQEEAVTAYRQVIRLNPELVESSQKIRQIKPEIWESWFNLNNLSQIERYKALALGVEYIAGTDVEGDIAEFGTMWGNTAKFLAFALSRTDSNPYITLKLSQMKLHLFDSFQGLPYSEAQADQESPHVKTGVWGPGTCKGSTKEQVLEICKQYLPESRIRIYEGWFQDTLPHIPTKTKFSMIHIDSDLYQSAIEVLDTCFAREFVQEGTVIFFDDWNCNRASPKFGERRAWQEIQEKYSVNFSDWGIYSTGGYRIIVHSYNIPNNS